MHVCVCTQLYNGNLVFTDAVVHLSLVRGVNWGSKWQLSLSRVMGEHPGWSSGANISTCEASCRILVLPQEHLPLVIHSTCRCLSALA